MANSFAERPTLTCPQCGQSFTPEIWLIIDAVERPDLLAQAYGTIHRVVYSSGLRSDTGNDELDACDRPDGNILQGQ